MRGSVRAAIIAGCLVSFLSGGGIGWVSQGNSPDLVVATESESAFPASTDGPTAEAPVQTISTQPPVPRPTSLPGRYTGDVLAYGDSILILTDACLSDRGFTVDSEGSRPIRSGPDELRTYGAGLPDRVLIHLGTNGGAYLSDFTSIMEVLGPDRIVTFATIQLPDDYDRYTFEDRTNEVIRSLPGIYPNVRVFDWHAASDDRPDWLYEDGYHPNPLGCAAYARLAERVVRAP